MIPEFEDLAQEEQDLMYGAPIMVAILVAGADGKIDRSEMREAIAVSSMKKVKARKELMNYYDEVSTDFEDKLKFGISKYPNDPKSRHEKIVAELTMINEILPKLNKKFAIKYYESLKDFGQTNRRSFGRSPGIHGSWIRGVKGC